MTESKKSIALIGMSNIGKTYWAKRLATEYGFAPIGCDSLIETRLRSKLGQKGVTAVAQWMGQPYDARYAETSTLYLTYEKEALNEALAERAAHPHLPYVIDTTGSVIYTGKETLDHLRAETRILYFESSPAHLDELFRRFVKHPKPVIWGDVYRPNIGEEPRATLKRCYAELLLHRAEKYRALAHVTIPYATHRAEKANISSYISEALA